jgi:hypothetical protein
MFPFVSTVIISSLTHINNKTNKIIFQAVIVITAAVTLVVVLLAAV